MKRPIMTLLALLMVIAGLGLAYAQSDRGIVIRPTAPTGGTVKGDQWLLVIGIDNYLQWPKLKTAVNDAKNVRDVLLTRYHFDKERLIELYDAEATRSNILTHLRSLAEKVKPEDSLLIFYAGHGQLDNITKEGSWVPVESGTKDPSAWISNHDIKNYLNIDAIKAKHILLVSDSCFAGDFFRGIRGNPPVVTDAVIKKAYERSSRQALTSGGLEPVSDTGFGGNSVFSHFFVKVLKENNKPFLIPSDLYPIVKSGVAQNAEQLPQLGTLYNVGGQDGEFVFFLKQADRLQDLSVGQKARQQELERLKSLETVAAKAKEKEQAEIAKKERELADLDTQIATMKSKLGTSAAGPNDSLQAMLTIVEKKETEAKKLEELKKQREAEEAQRQVEIVKLKEEAEKKRRAEIENDIAAYEKIVNSPYGKDMAAQAWQSLVNKYPEAKEVTAGNTSELKLVLFGEKDTVKNLTTKIAPTSSTASADTKTGSVTDIDGNVYQTVKIGNQVWTVENLRTTKYNDGTPIPLVTDKTAWKNLHTPGYCYYNNTSNADSIRKYGALYNWYAVDTKKLAPKGWHVPTYAEWTILENYLIANGYNWDGTTAGNKIAKSLAEKDYWEPSQYQGHPGNDMSTNNTSGFSGCPGGSRFSDGIFSLLGYNAIWWNATEYDASNAYISYISFGHEYCRKDPVKKSQGEAVRLLSNF